MKAANHTTKETLCIEKCIPGRVHYMFKIYPFIREPRKHSTLNPTEYPFQQFRVDTVVGRCDVHF